MHCRSCGSDKQLFDFYPDDSQCKSCTIQDMREGEHGPDWTLFTDILREIAIDHSRRNWTVVND
jgi:hypothetical protein